jgi:transglutaminase-like putative cysteine protease
VSIARAAPAARIEAARVRLRRGVCDDMAHLLIALRRGWMEVDPTKPGCTFERHIRLAVGRDNDDVPPMRGRFRDRTAQELRGRVELRAIDGGERM